MKRKIKICLKPGVTPWVLFDSTFYFHITFNPLIKVKYRSIH